MKHILHSVLRPVALAATSMRAATLAIPRSWDQDFAKFSYDERRRCFQAYPAGVLFMDAQVAG